MRDSIQQYLIEKHYDYFAPKVAFFDMDGVLFNSMPYHAQSWKTTMNEAGIPFTEHDAYLNEGRTGANTIRNYFIKHKGREATEEEIATMYKRKCEIFNEISTVNPIEGVKELLLKLKSDEIDIYIVTGSGQKSLLNTLNNYFPNIFVKEKMITAYDVQHCKPHPEPYLKALQKSGVAPNEAFVVENAPLGVESSVAAGLFTVAVNTGILTPEELANKCPNSGYVAQSMYEVLDNYNELIDKSK